MSDGHKYFVDDGPVDVSVTGLVGSYAEDCLVFFPNVMSGC